MQDGTGLDHEKWALTSIMEPGEKKKKKDVSETEQVITL